MLKIEYKLRLARGATMGRVVRVALKPVRGILAGLGGACPGRVRSSFLNGIIERQALIIGSADDQPDYF